MPWTHTTVQTIQPHLAQVRSRELNCFSYLEQLLCISSYYLHDTSSTRVQLNVSSLTLISLSIFDISLYVHMEFCRWKQFYSRKTRGLNFSQNNYSLIFTEKQCMYLDKIQPNCSTTFLCFTNQTCSISAVIYLIGIEGLILFHLWAPFHFCGCSSSSSLLNFTEHSEVIKAPLLLLLMYFYRILLIIYCKRLSRQNFSFKFVVLRVIDSLNTSKHGFVLL